MLRKLIICIAISAFLPSCMGGNTGAFLAGVADGASGSSYYSRTSRMERRQREIEDRLDRAERQQRNRDTQCIMNGGVPSFGSCL